MEALMSSQETTSSGLASCSASRRSSSARCASVRGNAALSAAMLSQIASTKRTRSASRSRSTSSRSSFMAAIVILCPFLHDERGLLCLQGSSRFALDELDLVAVGVLGEGDHRGAAFHRAGLARDLAALALYPLAGFLDIGHFDRDVTEGRAEIVPLDAVVVGELEHGAALFAVVADESERVLLLGPVGRAQKLHAQHLGIEPDRAIQVADPQHGVENSHDFSLA